MLEPSANCSSCFSKRENGDVVFVYFKGKGYDPFRFIGLTKGNYTTVQIEGRDVKIFSSLSDSCDQKEIVDKLKKNELPYLCYSCAGYKCLQCGEMGTLQDCIALKDDSNPEYIDRKMSYAPCSNKNCRRSKGFIEKLKF